MVSVVDRLGDGLDVLNSVIRRQRIFTDHLGEALALHVVCPWIDFESMNRSVLVRCRHTKFHPYRPMVADGFADVNARCYNQFTPLHLTSDPKIAKVLIESGADLKADAAARLLAC